jgi:hypothetical protein
MWMIQAVTVQGRVYPSYLLVSHGLLDRVMERLTRVPGVAMVIAELVIH